MLRQIQRRKASSGKGRFAVVASRYNARYVDAMVRAARAELKRAGAKTEVVRVPGAYEIPLAASRLARTRAEGLYAIICLGVILRGQTVHAEFIGREVSRALMDLQLRHEIPVIHEVLLLENEAQARARCLNPSFNRGTEAALTALAMAHVMQTL
jgi:6,7-dimethyl-8-ribityllumazine synthase